MLGESQAPVTSSSNANSPLFRLYFVKIHLYFAHRVVCLQTKTYMLANITVVQLLHWKLNYNGIG